jgi:class 3 adenylate cyclase
MTKPAERSYVVGRGKECDADLADGSVSRPHATLRIGEDGSLHLSDYPSKLGTFIFREGTWRQIEAATVGRDEPVMFGEYRTTLASVLDHIDRRMKSQTTDGDEIPEMKRSVAVIVADVVGYSKGMSQEPSGTLAALKAARRDVVDPYILLNGGRIFGEAGDSVCAEFRHGADAVRAARQIQERLIGRTFGPQSKAMKLRIGIHAGEVIVRQANLFGSPVNIAARLQTLATPGRICISADIRGQLDKEPGLPLIDLGEKSLKNIPEPIRVFEIDSTA